MNFQRLKQQAQLSHVLSTAQLRAGQEFEEFKIDQIDDEDEFLCADIMDEESGMPIPVHGSSIKKRMLDIEEREASVNGQVTSPQRNLN